MTNGSRSGESCCTKTDASSNRSFFTRETLLYKFGKRLSRIRRKDFNPTFTKTSNFNSTFDFGTSLCLDQGHEILNGTLRSVLGPSKVLGLTPLRCQFTRKKRDENGMSFFWQREVRNRGFRYFNAPNKGPVITLVMKFPSNKGLSDVLDKGVYSIKEIVNAFLTK